jgi:hypothetical protein
MVRKPTAVVTTRPLCNGMSVRSRANELCFLVCLRCYDVGCCLLDDDCDDIHHQGAERAGDGALDHHLETIGAFSGSFRIMCCQRS